LNVPVLGKEEPRSTLFLNFNHWKAPLWMYYSWILDDSGSPAGTLNVSKANIVYCLVLKRSEY